MKPLPHNSYQKNTIKNKWSTFWAMNKPHQSYKKNSSNPHTVNIQKQPPQSGLVISLPLLCLCLILFFMPNEYNVLFAVKPINNATELLTGDWTPLHVAVKNRVLKQDPITLSYDINGRNPEGYTPLHLAIQGQSSEWVMFLINHGADINAGTPNGHTALYYCIKYNYIHLAEYLLKKGASLNIVTQQGNTPLHEAARFSNLDIARLLILNGAQLNTHNSFQQTPLSMAITYHHPQMSVLLFDYMSTVELSYDDTVRLLGYVLENRTYTDQNILFQRIIKVIHMLIQHLSIDLDSLLNLMNANEIESMVLKISNLLNTIEHFKNLFEAALNTLPHALPNAQFNAIKSFEDLKNMLIIAYTTATERLTPVNNRSKNPRKSKGTLENPEIILDDDTPQQPITTTETTHPVYDLEDTPSEIPPPEPFLIGWDRLGLPPIIRPRTIVPLPSIHTLQILNNNNTNSFWQFGFPPQTESNLLYLNGMFNRYDLVPRSHR